MAAATIALALALAAPGPVPIRFPPGTLHGFPSLSDRAGTVIADGELAQQLAGRTLRVRVSWAFRDGRHVVEEDEFELGATLTQRRFSFVETAGGLELRRFEADLATGRASASRRHADGSVARDETRLDLPKAGAFAGYGVALAVAQLGLAAGAGAELGFVAFTPAPRAVTLSVRRDGEEVVAAAGRTIPCDRFTLHPEIPFPLSLFAGARDGHLWLTHAPPPALVRAEQNLAAKDDPVVVVDVIPRAPARPARARRPPTPDHPGAGGPAGSRPSTP
jgi:hypothetical protein